MAGKFKFNASKHPRGAGGKFTHTPDAVKKKRSPKGAKVSANPKLAKLDALDMRQRMRLLNSLSKKRGKQEEPEPQKTAYQGEYNRATLQLLLKDFRKKLGKEEFDKATAEFLGGKGLNQKADKLSGALTTLQKADKTRGSKETKGKGSTPVKVSIPTSAQLSTMKVKELEDLAGKLGAAVPLKYKNRKVSWVESIEKLRDSQPKATAPKETKPPKEKAPKSTKTRVTKPKDVKTGTPDRAALQKLKLTELQTLAKSIGATPPEKLKSRKDPWIDAITAKQKADAEKTEPRKEPVKADPTPTVGKGTTKTAKEPDSLPVKAPTPPGVPKGIVPTKGTNITHTDLIEVGKHYTEKAGVKRVPEEKVAAYRKATEAYARAGLEKDSVYEDEDKYDAKDRRAADEKFEKAKAKWQETEQEVEKAREALIPAHRELVKAIILHHGISSDKAAEHIAKVDMRLPDTQDRTATYKILSQFTQMTGAKVDTLKFIDRSRSRAFAKRSNGQVNVGDGLRPATLYHEFAHHIEYSRKELADAAVAWRASRASGKSFVDRNNGEEYIPDKFHARYVGRVYRRGDGTDAGVTEVLSTGAEHFINSKKMQELYETDPEHFHFMVGAFLHQ
jgi:hypothetical protein